jgi:lipopolysaccharide export system protein LptA
MRPTALVPALLLTLVCGLAAVPAVAQDTSNAFGAFSKNSGEPIDIESDQLIVHDQQKYATFKGNVKAVQGTTTLRSVELDVHYAASGADSMTGAAPKSDGTGAPQPAGTPAAAGEQVATADAKPAAGTEAKPAAGADAKAAAGAALGEGGNQITKIEARGSVVITSGQDQTTTSDWALYDVPAQLVTVGGNVVLTQGKNVLKGDRLVIDLKTGESRFENTGNVVGSTGGKIRALFMPKQDAAAKGKDGKSDKSGKPGDEQAHKDTPEADKPATAEATSGGVKTEDSAAPDSGAAGGAPEPLFPGMPH